MHICNCANARNHGNASNTAGTLVPGISFFEVGNYIPGMAKVYLERYDSEFLDMLSDYDVVISKGQTNYEILSNYKDIFFRLIAKCSVVADSIGVPLQSGILFYSRE